MSGLVEKPACGRITELIVRVSPATSAQKNACAGITAQGFKIRVNDQNGRVKRFELKPCAVHRCDRVKSAIGGTVSRADARKKKCRAKRAINLAKHCDLTARDTQFGTINIVVRWRKLPAR
ncbi:MAG: hypothetical protein EBV34_18860 [Betaproteobacteria bacterium]|nr:hypothetical protein [Betaproteobacteria bacterium]